MADTTGDPLPTLTYAAADGGDELLARLEWVTEEDLGISLDYEEIREHGVDGYSSGGRIVVRTSLSPTAKAAVLLHEISHEQLHWGPNRDDAKAKSRRQRELEAEATAYVFCESDTEGEPLPTLTYGAESGGEELLSRLEWVTEEDLGISLDYEEIREPGVDGYSSGGRIVVRTSLSPTAKAAVLLHEISHEQLHWGPNRDDAKAKSRRQRELEAEATAYVVMRHFGIDHVASHYLATYNIDGEQLKQSLQTISATAKFLIAAIDPQLNPNQEAAADAASDPPA